MCLVLLFMPLLTKAGGGAWEPCRAAAVGRALPPRRAAGSGIQVMLASRPSFRTWRKITAFVYLLEIDHYLDSTSRCRGGCISEI